MSLKNAYKNTFDCAIYLLCHNGISVICFIQTFHSYCTQLEKDSTTAEKNQMKTLHPLARKVYIFMVDFVRKKKC